MLTPFMISAMWLVQITRAQRVVIAALDAAACAAFAPEIAAANARKAKISALLWDDILAQAGTIPVDSQLEAKLERARSE